ncbi:MAG: hypothetical protein AB1485_05140 [Candidatus Thermoplasmatota archaeon]
MEDTDDTDNDGMKDREEVYKYGFNPYLNDSEKENPRADFDKDGITNVHEAEIYGTDPLNTDTDCDKIDDLSEIRGINVRYIVDKGIKGYLFYKDAPAIYDKTFTYKTSPFNPDTDFDGQNDYNDLIPLDYN